MLSKGRLERNFTPDMRKRGIRNRIFNVRVTAMRRARSREDRSRSVCLPACLPASLLVRIALRAIQRQVLAETTSTREQMTGVPNNSSVHSYTYMYVCMYARARACVCVKKITINIRIILKLTKYFPSVIFFCFFPCLSWSKMCNFFRSFSKRVFINLNAVFLS